MWPLVCHKERDTSGVSHSGGCDKDLFHIDVSKPLNLILQSNDFSDLLNDQSL